MFPFSGGSLPRRTGPIGFCIRHGLAPRWKRPPGECRLSFSRFLETHVLRWCTEVTAGNELLPASGDEVSLGTASTDRSSRFPSWRRVAWTAAELGD